MAIIKCPECGLEISDKASKCIHCGKDISIKEMVSGEIKCPECGEILSETDEICSNCGCPVNMINAKFRKNQMLQGHNDKTVNKSKKIVIGVCACSGIGYKVYSDKKAEQKAYNTYIDNLDIAQSLMVIGASNAEYLCNKIAKVWSDTIFKETNSETSKYTRPNGFWVSDFNETLANLFADTDTISTIGDIKANQNAVKDIMKKLQDVPNGLEKCYDTVTELNDAYKTMTEMAINPSGSYSEYASNKNTAISDFMSYYDKLDIQIPDKK